jgi:hypothetical protein
MRTWRRSSGKVKRADSLAVDRALVDKELLGSGFEFCRLPLATLSRPPSPGRRKILS